MDFDKDQFSNKTIDEGTDVVETSTQLVNFPSSWNFIKYAISAYKQDFLSIAKIYSLPLFIFILSQFVTQFMRGSGNAIGALVSILGLIVNFIALVALFNLIENRLTAGEALHASRKSFFKAAIVTFLIGLAVGGGFLIFVLPGIYFGLRFMFSMFIFVRTDKRGISALATSWNITRGLAMKLFIKIINLQFILLLITVIFTLLAVGTIVFIMYLDDPTLPSQFVALFSNSQSLEYNQKISLGLTFNSYLVLYTIAQNILFMFFIQPLNLYFVHSLFRFVLKVRSENSIATESSESLIAVKRIIMLGVVALIIGIGSVLLLTIQAF